MLEGRLAVAEQSWRGRVDHSTDKLSRKPATPLYALRGRYRLNFVDARSSSLKLDG